METNELDMEIPGKLNFDNFNIEDIHNCPDAFFVKSYLENKIKTDQEKLDNSLVSIDEVLSSWKRISHRLAVPVLFETVYPISCKILCLYKETAIYTFDLYKNSICNREQTNLFLEWVYYCLVNKCFPIMDIKFIKKTIKKITCTDNDIKSLAEDCIKICNSSLKEVRKMNLIEIIDLMGDRVMFYCNRSSTRLAKAYGKGAGVLGLRNVDSFYGPTDYTCSFSLSKEVVNKLLDNRVCSDLSEFLERDKDCILLQEEGVKVYMNIAKIGDAELNYYLVGELPSVSLRRN